MFCLIGLEEGEGKRGVGYRCWAFVYEGWGKKD